jgi:uncharacterized protein
MMNKFVLVLLALTLTACDSELPRLEGHVVDDASVLSQAEEAQLEQKLAAHQASYHHQVVVVTLYSLAGDSIAEVADTLSKGWAIGHQSGYRGVLLLVAPTERQLYIDVGVGLKVQLSESVVGEIINQQMLPAFSQGKMAEGIQQGVDAILAAITPAQAP